MLVGSRRVLTRKGERCEYILLRRESGSTSDILVDEKSLMEMQTCLHLCQTALLCAG